MGEVYNRTYNSVKFGYTQLLYILDQHARELSQSPVPRVS